MSKFIIYEEEINIPHGLPPGDYTVKGGNIVSNIILTRDTDIQGILSSSRDVILRQGNMNSVSIFKFQASCASDPREILRRGYVKRDYETYRYNEVDRLATLYPWAAGAAYKDCVNGILRTIGFANVKASFYNTPEQLTITLPDEGFVQMAKRLGSHAFHVDPQAGLVYIAVKGISGRGDGVVMKDIMDLGATRSLYCRVFAEHLRSGQTRILFERVVK